MFQSQGRVLDLVVALSLGAFGSVAALVAVDAWNDGSGLGLFVGGAFFVMAGFLFWWSWRGYKAWWVARSKVRRVHAAVAKRERAEAARDNAVRAREKVEERYPESAPWWSKECGVCGHPASCHGDVGCNGLDLDREVGGCSCDVTIDEFAQTTGGGS